MDGNTPFTYSPIQEISGQVVGAAPLFYGMLLFTRAGTGTILPTSAQAGGVNVTAYAVAPGDGSTNIVLDNKDPYTDLTVTVDVGATVSSADVVYLQGPSPASLGATSGITLAGAGISPSGVWSPNPPIPACSSGTTVVVDLPPASAALVRAR